ncbi:MAG: nucleolar RNA-binding Nop10p family protein [Nanoarchaeota archaeon]|nr:nucleolar RNA-binding Nop10p family protein [Nanoarchaeota archaeon]
MKLKICKSCNIYTLKENCSKCNFKTSDAHYKFIKIRDVPKSDINIVRKN